MNKIDTDSATILGMWFGIGGFITGDYHEGDLFSPEQPKPSNS